MVKYFDEEWPKEEEMLNIGLKMSRQNKKDRKKVKRVFCIGNGESRQGFDLEKLRQHGKIYGCNALYRDFMPDVLTSVDHGIMHEIYHSGVAQKIPCYFRDWTKVPGMTYESVLMNGVTELEAKEHLDDILISNERGNAKEYVMHGSNLKGIVEMLKKDGEKYKRNVNTSTIKVSWIHEPDYSHSIKDLPHSPKTGPGTGDFGWSCGPSSAWAAIDREKPKEIYMIGHDLHSHNDKINNIYKSTKHYTAAGNGPTPAVNWIKQWKSLFEWCPNINFYKVNIANDGRDKVNGPIEEWEGHNNLFYVDYSTLDNLS